MDNSSRKMTRSEKATKKAANSKQKRKILVICSVVLAVCLVLGIGGFFLYSHYMTNRPIEANVTVAGVPVKGMTKQEATDAISEAFLLSQRGKQMVVKLGDETITLTSDVTKVQLDTANLVDAISKVTAQYPQQEVFPIAEYVQMDKEAVMSILQAVTDKLQSTLVQSSYVVEGKAPEALDKACFVLAGIDEKHLLQAVETAVDLTSDGNHGIPVPDYVEENVSTKVVKIIQSYTGVVDKMVWRKF